MIEQIKDERFDPEWTAKLLSHLEDYEKVNGRPRVAGLRRVIRRVFDVVESGPIEFVSNGLPGADIYTSLRGATVSYRVELINQIGNHEVYGGLADAYPDNLDDVMRKYPVANAETRAEGRAYVKALALNVCTADEIAGDAANDVFSDPIYKEPADDINWRFFDNMFQSNDIDAQSFFNKYGKSVGLKKVREMTRGQAIQLGEMLNKFKQGEAIPDELKGYSSTWNSFLSK